MPVIGRYTREFMEQSLGDARDKIDHILAKVGQLNDDNVVNYLCDVETVRQRVVEVDNWLEKLWDETKTTKKEVEA